MSKRVLEPNTTLYPVAVVLVTTGGNTPNVITCNRLVSCSAEPPRLGLAIRLHRYSYDLIRSSREFVVNIPTPNQLTLTDYLGVVSGRDEDKIAVAGLKLAPAHKVNTPLLADCPVNIECTVEREIDLDSHTLFIGLVQAVHVEESLLDANGDGDLARAGILSTAEAKAQPEDAFIRVGGMAVVEQRPGTAKGMVFISLEDETGMMDVVVRPNIYERFRPLIRHRLLLLVEGTIQRGSGAISLLVSRALEFKAVAGPLGEAKPDPMPLEDRLEAKTSTVTTR